jgi:uncharacterized protein (TIGR02145 family)
MKKRIVIESVLFICFIVLLCSGCKKNGTDAPDPVPVLTTDAITVITQTTATVNSNVESDGGAQLKSMGVCWSTTETPTIKDSKSTDPLGTGSYVSSLTDLTANTKYYVRAYATNGAGTTTYGNEKSFNTLKPFPENGSIVKDIDNNIYHTIIIGNQAWLVENLKSSKYRNGDVILNFTDTAKWAWQNKTTGAYSNYNNDTTISKIYGKLYNWYAVNEARGFCPVGWHVPSDVEWKELIDFLGGETIAGNKLLESGTSHWRAPNTGATNTSGFTALPAGYREIDGFFPIIV